MKTGNADADQTHSIVSYSDTLEPQKIIAEKHEPSPKKSTVLKFNPDGSLCIPAELKDKINQQSQKPLKTGPRRSFTGPKSKRPSGFHSDSADASSSSESPLAPNSSTLISNDWSSSSSAKKSDEQQSIPAEEGGEHSLTVEIVKSEADSDSPHVDRKGKRRKNYTQLPRQRGFQPSAKVEEGCCHFCFTDVMNNDVGELKSCGEVTAHYKCLLFASGLMQHGSNDDDLWGFMVPDVRKELGRGKRLKCSYCRQGGALVGCHKARCPYSYHLTCGIYNGCLMQFYDSFRSYCQNHRPLQYFAKEMIGLTVDCPVCREEIEIGDKIVPNEVLVTECCNMTPIHRKCIQAQADASGYFFRCPMCNNEKKYNSVMKIMGVNIPQRDAAWEKDGYYDDLLEEYWRCDVPICICKEGRQHDSRKKDQWDLLKCTTCGQSGAHPACLGFDKKAPKLWQCRNCVEILAKIEEDREKERKVKEAELQKVKDKKKEAIIQSFSNFEMPCSSKDLSPHSANVPPIIVVGILKPTLTATPPVIVKKEKKKKKIDKKLLSPDRDPFLMTPQKLKEAVYQLCVSKLKVDNVVSKQLDANNWSATVTPPLVIIDEESEEEDEEVKQELKAKNFDLIIIKSKYTCPSGVVVSDEEEEEEEEEEPVKEMSTFQQYSHGVKERKWLKAKKIYSKQDIEESPDDTVHRIRSGPSSKKKKLVLKRKPSHSGEEKLKEGIELIWNPQSITGQMTSAHKSQASKNISFLIKETGTKEEDLRIIKVENSVSETTLKRMITIFYKIAKEFDIDTKLIGDSSTGAIRLENEIDQETLESILEFVKLRVKGESLAGEGVIVSSDQTKEIFEMISETLCGVDKEAKEDDKSHNELLSHLLVMDCSKSKSDGVSPCSSTTSNVENKDSSNKTGKTKRKYQKHDEKVKKRPKLRQYKNYPHELFLKAIDKITSEELTMREASALYKIPLTTIQLATKKILERESGEKVDRRLKKNSETIIQLDRTGTDKQEKKKKM